MDLLAQLHERKDYLKGQVADLAEIIGTYRSALHLQGLERDEAHELVSDLQAFLLDMPAEHDCDCED